MQAWMRPSFLLSTLAVLSLGLTLQAQVHGVPASVSSFGFGGSTSMTPGVAASVTSLGPNGFGNGRRFGNCCANPFFSSNAQPRIFVSHRRHLQGNFFPGVPVYSVPYYPQVVVVQSEAVAEEDEDYAPGPTVFERHGSRGNHYRAREVEPEPAPAPAATAKPAKPEPVVDQPSTVLVFKDGHQSEVQNYAIVADTLFDLGEGRTHKIRLADLDLPATRKINDDRGVDFQVPPKGN